MMMVMQQKGALAKGWGAAMVTAVRGMATRNINGRLYRDIRRPTVAVCLDGGNMEYYEAAIAGGAMPFLGSVLNNPATVTRGLVRSAVPTFTNPNNIAIVTGVPPAVTGICGNFWYDEENNQEVMMNDPKDLRCGTILASFGRTNPVVVVTAKDKLLRLLSHGTTNAAFFVGYSIEKGVAFTAPPLTKDTEDKEERVVRKGVQLSTQALLESIGITSMAQLLASPLTDASAPSSVESTSSGNPDIYSADASIKVLESGLNIFERLLASGKRAPLMYLSTTDYIQHKFAPGSEGANSFYARLDKVFEAFHAKGAVLGITADHGMNDKTVGGGDTSTHNSSQPNIVFLEDVLKAHGIDARVILPITDPYVVHHGALGGYATCYIKDKSLINKTLAILSKTPGIDVVLPKHDAAQRFELPSDRIGDVVVLATRNAVLGKSPAAHDLTNVPHLRSHGALHEQVVPLIINRALTDEYKTRLLSGGMRNFDLLDVLLNGVRAL